MKTCQTGSLKQRHGFAQNRNLNFPPKERVPATLAAKKVENKESQNGILIIPSRTLQGNPLGLCTMSLMNISSRGRMSWKKLLRRLLLGRSNAQQKFFHGYQVHLLRSFVAAIILFPPILCALSLFRLRQHRLDSF